MTAEKLVIPMHDIDDPEKQFSTEIEPGNLTWVSVFDDAGKKLMAVGIEINKGVPALHIAHKHDDNDLHIHRSDEGFVLALDDDNLSFDEAPLSALGYFSDDALIVKVD